LHRQPAFTRCSRGAEPAFPLARDDDGVLDVLHHVLAVGLVVTIAVVFMLLTLAGRAPR